MFARKMMLMLLLCSTTLSISCHPSATPPQPEVVQSNRVDTQLVEKTYDPKLFVCTAPTPYPARDPATGHRKQSDIASAMLGNAKSRIDCKCQLNAVGVLLGAATPLAECAVLKSS